MAESSGLGTDSWRRGLGREEFEDQLAHALFILRLKFEKFDSDGKRLNGGNHSRIDLDIRLSGRGM